MVSFTNKLNVFSTNILWFVACQINFHSLTLFWNGNAYSSFSRFCSNHSFLIIPLQKNRPIPVTLWVASIIVSFLTNMHIPKCRMNMSSIQDKEDTLDMNICSILSRLKWFRMSEHKYQHWANNLQVDNLKKKQKQKSAGVWFVGFS